MKRYPEYKESGVDWIGEIPFQWAINRLKFISDCNTSNVDKHSKEDESNVKLCNYTDVYKNDKIHSRMDFMSATASPAEIEKFQLKKDDVLITKDSETPFDIAIPAVVIEDLNNVLCGYHLALIRSNDKYVIGTYLYYLFKSYRFNQQFTIAANGITRFGLSISDVRNAIISLPSIVEQSKIAIFLDEKNRQIDDLIGKKQKVIELLHEERTALINQVVTKGSNKNLPMKDSGIEWLGEIPEHWELYRLKSLGSIRYGLGQPPKSMENGLPLIRATNIQKGKIVNIDMVFVNPNELPLAKNPILKKGEIIVVRSGAYTGDSAIITEEYAGSVAGYDMVFTSIKCCPDFISYSFLSHYVLENQLIPSSCRAAQPHLNAEELGSTLIACPPYEEQVRLSNYLQNQTARLEATILKLQSEIDLFSEYKTSLINEVVTGKIKIKDAN
jgi:type I restriction enzyme, S subunit